MFYVIGRFGLKVVVCIDGHFVVLFHEEQCADFAELDATGSLATAMAKKICTRRVMKYLIEFFINKDSQDT